MIHNLQTYIILYFALYWSVLESALLNLDQIYIIVLYIYFIWTIGSITAQPSLPIPAWLQLQLLVGPCFMLLLPSRNQFAPLFCTVT